MLPADSFCFLLFPDVSLSVALCAEPARMHWDWPHRSAAISHSETFAMNTTVTTAAPAMLLTPRQAATALCLSERKLWGLTKAGHIRAVKFGRAVRYDRADLEAAIQAAKS